MISNLAFTWLEARQVAEQVIFTHLGEHLKDIEINVLRGAWEGTTYQQMAALYHLSENYIRGDIGNNLWKKLSEALGEEVTKKNFKEALRRVWDQQNSLSSPPPIKLSPTELTFPEGSEPLNSPFYIKRDGIESLCYKTIVKPGSLIRIKAPKLLGKTSLMNRILVHAQSEKYRTAYIDLSSVERGMLKNLDKFLRWFCFMIGRQLNVENKLNDYWDTEILGSNGNCTLYFEEYLLSTLNSPLVIALDEVDRIFPVSEVVDDFFGLLRSWHEKGKIFQQWQYLRLILVHSTEVYISLDLNQSPFNAGVPVELLEFNAQQIHYLANLHELMCNESQIQELMNMIGGHPYLIRLAFYEMSVRQISLEQILKEAATEAGIYSNHLRRYLYELQTNSQPNSQDLIQSLKKVVTSPNPVELEAMQAYKLHSMGLIKRQENLVIPRCQLYRDYFRRVL